MHLKRKYPTDWKTEYHDDGTIILMLLQKPMNKLKALWKLLWCKDYFLVTRTNEAPHSNWQTVPTYNRYCSTDDKLFLTYVKMNLKNICGEN